MSQLDLFGSDESPKKIQSILNGEYLYIPHFYDISKANLFFEELLHTIHWDQQKMNMYGKEVLFPRLTSWYGDQDKPYTFSGITLQPYAWTNALQIIKRDIEAEVDCNFNSVLLNRYRDGNDSISWHTDAERELGENPIIASVNFGQERVFQLKHIETNERIDILLEHGSLLVMMGELQHFWKHQIPKSKKPMKERINLTFRVIK